MRAKSAALTELAIALYDEWLAPLGFELGSPRDGRRAAARMSSLRHAEAWQICRALIERAARRPGLPRAGRASGFGFAPLYTRFVDVWDALDRLREVVERGEHRQIAAPPARVT